VTSHPASAHSVAPLPSSVAAPLQLPLPSVAVPLQLPLPSVAVPLQLLAPSAAVPLQLALPVSLPALVVSEEVELPLSEPPPQAVRPRRAEAARTSEVLVVLVMWSVTPGVLI
jgi:hypothetical protein